MKINSHTQNSFINTCLKLFGLVNISEESEFNSINWITHMNQDLLKRGFVDSPETIERIKSLTDAELSELVKAYLYSDSPGLGSLIVYVIERVEKIFIDELKNPHSYQRSNPKEIYGLSNKTIVEKILQLYKSKTPTSFVPHLHRKFNEVDIRIRQDIAFHIANSGSKNEFDVLKKILEDPTSEEKFYVLVGLERALNNKTLSAEDISVFYESLFNLILNKNDFLLVQKVIEMLIKINKDRLVDDLKTKIDYSYDNQNLDSILRKATELQIILPPDKLYPLLDLYKREVIYSYITGIFCETLKALALTKDSRVLNQIKIVKKEKPSLAEEKVEHSRNARLHRRKAAKEALSILENLNNIVPILWEVKNKYGYDSLPQIVRDILNLTSLDGEVGNGGFSQYFFNSSGDYSKDTLISLNRHKLSSHFKIFKSVIDILDPKILDMERNKRINVLEKTPQEVYKRVGKYESQWYDLISIDEEVQSIINKHTKELRNFIDTVDKNLIRSL